MSASSGSVSSDFEHVESFARQEELIDQLTLQVSELTNKNENMFDAIAELTSNVAQLMSENANLNSLVAKFTDNNIPLSVGKDKKENVVERVAALSEDNNAALSEANLNLTSENNTSTAEPPMHHPARDTVVLLACAPFVTVAAVPTAVVAVVAGAVALGAVVIGSITALAIGPPLLFKHLHTRKRTQNLEASSPGQQRKLINMTDFERPSGAAGLSPSSMQPMQSASPRIICTRLP